MDYQDIYIKGKEGDWPNGLVGTNDRHTSPKTGVWSPEKGRKEITNSAGPMTSTGIHSMCSCPHLHHMRMCTRTHTHLISFLNGKRKEEGRKGKNRVNESG